MGERREKFDLREKRTETMKEKKQLKTYSIFTILFY